MRKLCVYLAAAMIFPLISAKAETFNYDFAINQEYGVIRGSMMLTDDASGHITGGDAVLVGAGLNGPLDFSVVSTPLYCGDSCYGWRSGDGTDFYGFDNSYSGGKLNDVVFASSTTWGTGYSFGIYSIGPGRYLNGLFGPGGSPDFYDYNLATALVAGPAPEPATWALMASGFAALGLAGLARRRASSRDGGGADLTRLAQEFGEARTRPIAQREIARNIVATRSPEGPPR